MVISNIKLTYTNNQYLEQRQIICESFNVYRALASIVHSAQGPHWKVEIEPTKTEYFTTQEKTVEPSEQPHWIGLTKEQRNKLHSMWCETDELPTEQDVADVVEKWLKEANTW
jgi:hypothetical protein